MRPVGLKTYWLDDDEVSEEDYEGLSEAALLMLADDDEIEIREQSERRDFEAPSEAKIDLMTGEDRRDEVADVVQVDPTMLMSIKFAIAATIVWIILFGWAARKTPVVWISSLIVYGYRLVRCEKNLVEINTANDRAGGTG